MRVPDARITTSLQSSGRITDETVGSSTVPRRVPCKLKKKAQHKNQTLINMYQGYQREAETVMCHRCHTGGNDAVYYT